MTTRDDPEKPKKTSPRRPHTIADHALGALVRHVHAPGEDHDHDHDHDGMDLLPPGATDAAVLTSIGIDIGSSGTQIALARLTLELAAPMTPPGDADTPPSGRLETRRRETLYQSPIYLTPFDEADGIDEPALGLLLDRSFADAGLDPDSIDCGVVILTGAARERRNAEIIARRLAETCGDIVSASAGHHLEARLAAHGSGAIARSAEFRQRYLNIDIGGATTKLAICDGGRVVDTAALAIGGRLVATDATDRIVRLDHWGRRHATEAGIAWDQGGTATWNERQQVARAMAARLVAALTGKLDVEAFAALYLTEPVRSLEGIDGIIVSGGVGEYVYGREKRSFGDLGLPLGREFARYIDAGALPWPLVPAAECIRATVLGASSWSVQLSGRTGCVTNPATLLPRRNLPVINPALDLSETISPTSIAEAIGAELSRHDLSGATLDQGEALGPTPVLALRWRGEPDHARLAALAEGLKRGFIDLLPPHGPALVIVDGDIAASLGAVLTDELAVANDLLVLDGIALDGLDYVDLGRIRLPSGTVPVTIKTLVFRDEREQKAARKSPRPARQGEPG